MPGNLREFRPNRRNLVLDRDLKRSQHWKGRAEAVIPAGAQTFSKSPTSFMQGVAPNFLDRGQGARVWDVDANCYIDTIMGLGALILGHAHPDVNAAAEEALRKGMSFCLPHPLEVEVAELLCRLVPCAQMVRFGKNGSDATTAAVRVARAFTGRDKVIRSGYHGWHDWYIGSTSRFAGVPDAVRRLTLNCLYNDAPAMQALFREHGGDVACVMMEPVTHEPPRDDFLPLVQDLCHRHKCLLIFDEVVTGFRFAMGGAQQLFGVTPDLACFGKAMANGFPLSAVAGRADVMRRFEEVFFSTTHGGEAVSLAACRATLRVLEERSGLDGIWNCGLTLIARVNEMLKSRNLEHIAKCIGYPPWPLLRFTAAASDESILLNSLFHQEMLKRGVITQGSHLLSLAHDTGIIEEILTAYAGALDVIAEAVAAGDVARRLEGPPLRPVLRQNP